MINIEIFIADDGRGQMKAAVKTELFILFEGETKWDIVPIVRTRDLFPGDEDHLELVKEALSHDFRKSLMDILESGNLTVGDCDGGTTVKKIIAISSSPQPVEGYKYADSDVQERKD